MAYFVTLYLYVNLNKNHKKYLASPQHSSLLNMKLVGLLERQCDGEPTPQERVKSYMVLSGCLILYTALIVRV